MRAFLLSLALLLSVLPLGGHAQSRLPGLTEGVEYNTIDGGQPYRQLPPGMVEVAEVFAYTCPHCAHMAPMIDDWSRTLPAYARVVYVPGVFGRDDAWARAYFAEEASKTIPLLHRRLFTAINETGDLPRNADVNQITRYASKVPGVNAAAFSAAIRNDAVLLPKLKLAYEFSQRSGVEGTPSLIIAGRYMILGNSYENLLENAGKVIRALAPRRATAPARPVAPAGPSKPRS